ncbi:hypothetical protein [Actinoallomurus rhizosphaericola]|uniref:hypothetical protein n=1 Tax=Actinoallomurus rhizosphaericola TaxID=2952536 RepID=UPI0020922823|nr:hypothetical protein [Actinoallomurus rhizosphaericola]MCO5999548.1 hypothetical protein [Actinoallomurus rhizosphaericola]
MTDTMPTPANATPAEITLAGATPSDATSADATPAATATASGTPARARPVETMSAGSTPAGAGSASVGARCETRPDVDAGAAAPDEFYRRWVAENPLLGERRALLARWLDDPAPREEIAEELGLPLGVLLRSFNDTAPIGAPVPFGYRGVRFAVTAMTGVCDDIVGDRFPRFGTPVTLRCHLDEPDLLPQGMFEAADWNFMDAGRPGFLGYAYGVREGDTVYLAGLQSDLAVRYGYLFQGRGEGTDVRTGDEVVFRTTEDLVARFGDRVPVLRRTFQRYWIDVLLGAVAAWAATEPALRTLGLLWFDLEPQEDARGHLVHRVYRQLPERLAADVRHVHVGGRCHTYRTAPFSRVATLLGERWSAVPAPRAPADRPAR